MERLEFCMHFPIESPEIRASNDSTHNTVNHVKLEMEMSKYAYP